MSTPEPDQTTQKQGLSQEFWQCRAIIEYRLRNDTAIALNYRDAVQDTLEDCMNELFSGGYRGLSDRVGTVKLHLLKIMHNGGNLI